MTGKWRRLRNETEESVGRREFEICDEIPWPPYDQAGLERAAIRLFDLRRRHGTAGHSNIAIVIEADPDHAQEVGSEAGEPSVAGRSGLSRGGQCKPARADARARALVQDVF